MQLTLNDIPITVDPTAAQEIVRRHLLKAEDDAQYKASLKEWNEVMEAWRKTATPTLNEGEKLIGSYAGPDGKTTVVILLPGKASSLTWPKAMQWAKDQGGDLPNRIEALLLFQHHRDEFQRVVYWTNEKHAEVSSYAWYQSFDNGNQNYWLQDNKFMARAVRRVAI